MTTMMWFCSEMKYHDYKNDRKNLNTMKYLENIKSIKYLKRKLQNNY
jgi:hypothetical protein